MKEIDLAEVTETPEEVVRKKRIGLRRANTVRVNSWIRKGELPNYPLMHQESLGTGSSVQDGLRLVTIEPAKAVGLVAGDVLEAARTSDLGQRAEKTVRTRVADLGARAQSVLGWAESRLLGIRTPYEPIHEPTPTRDLSEPSQRTPDQSFGPPIPLRTRKAARP